MSRLLRILVVVFAISPMAAQARGGDGGLVFILGAIAVACAVLIWCAVEFGEWILFFVTAVIPLWFGGYVLVLSVSGRGDVLLAFVGLCVAGAGAFRMVGYVKAARRWLRRRREKQEGKHAT